jgi:hypothetical protein
MPPSASAQGAAAGAGARELWSWGPLAFELRCHALPHLDGRLGLAA